MGEPLRVLLVENDENDAILVLRELERGGYDVHHRRVETSDAMREALADEPWDIVIADYYLPRFDAPTAFETLTASRADVPFIIVSGTVGEEVAVQAMRAGVHDYVLKDSLGRLCPVVERELRESALRREQKRMEEQLLISDRMASVGTLAAGVAHEINNPLAVLITNLHVIDKSVAALERIDRERPDSVMATRGPEVERLRRRIDGALEDARECAERVRLIVRDLKIFSRSRDEESVGPVDLVPVLDSSIRMAWNEVRHRARLVKDWGPDVSAFGNEARLSQVFLNLVVNAAQAIPEGRAEQNEIRVTARREGDDAVVVEVSDTGEGIPEEVLPHIFDPFFTTKPVGVGSGLGLVICDRIVRSLGGEISVESEVGVGTTVRTRLRAAPRPRVRTRRSTSPPPSGRRGRVLVIDDEILLGTAVARMLEAEHDVTVEESARAAAARIARGERFDVILCDLMMPHMTGMELYAELQRTCPDQATRMVFTTGGAFSQDARAFFERTPNARIEKPFVLDKLRAVIASVVEAEGQPSPGPG